MPSFSHCWKLSLPGAGCATSPPHCARIHRTRTCSSSGSYCRSIFCCTSRLRPYDGPRFAMLTAEGSAEIGPLSAALVAPGHPAWDRCGPVPAAWWSPSGTAVDSRHGSCSPAVWQSPILPSQAAWTSGMEPYRLCQALPGLCPALPASCPATQEQVLGLRPPKGDGAIWPWAGWAAPWPLSAGVGPPPPRASVSPRLGPTKRTRTWQALAAGRSLFAKLTRLLGLGARSGTGSGAQGLGLPPVVPPPQQGSRTWRALWPGTALAEVPPELVPTMLGRIEVVQGAHGGMRADQCCSWCAPSSEVVWIPSAHQRRSGHAGLPGMCIASRAQSCTAGVWGAPWHTEAGAHAAPPPGMQVSLPAPVPAPQLGACGSCRPGAAQPTPGGTRLSLGQSLTPSHG